MSCGGCVRAAAIAVAAFIVCCVCVAAVPALAADDNYARYILFSGSDTSRNSLFVHGGLLMAPDGFSQDGVLVKVLLSTGRYRYDAGSLGGEQVNGAEWLAQVLPGFRLKRGDLEAKFFVGPEMQEHRLWPNDPDNRLRGRAFGLRMATELWYQPTPQFMAAADASLASNGTGFTSRAAVGWRIFDWCFVGPETQIYGADGYRQTRLGAHLTGIQIGPVEMSAAGGVARDTDRRTGAYLRLGIMAKR